MVLFSYLYFTQLNENKNLSNQNTSLILENARVKKQLEVSEDSSVNSMLQMATGLSLRSCVVDSMQRFMDSASVTKTNDQVFVILATNISDINKCVADFEESTNKYNPNLIK